MNLQEALETLGHHESFAVLAKEIVKMREDSIQELHSADIDKLSQVSGKILAYDEIISLCDWDSLRRRFSEM
jgi:hypothetical protein|tara:strand:+ start:1295 stop:1510 length:216 start_codon:yes stop_codon:yes gene_type:complete